MRTNYTSAGKETQILDAYHVIDVQESERKLPRLVKEGRTYFEIPRLRIRATTLVIGLTILLFGVLGATPGLQFAIGALVFVLLMDIVNVGTGNE